jgi:peptidoglycan/LPS O-acetylase OafA/YrhL
MARQTARIPELDGLRGVAISLVIVYHYFYYNPGVGHHTTGLIRKTFVLLEKFFAVGWSGVDLFFVLSGFLIGSILLDVRASPHYFKTFYLRRFYRIVPIYYAWISAYLLLTCFSGEFFDRVRIVVPLFLFLQNFGLQYSSGLANAWFLPAWSLAVEEQFYLIAPLVIRLMSRRKLYMLLVAVILAAPILRVWVYHHIPVRPGSLPLDYTLMPCRADSLAIGILAALLWRNLVFREWLTGHSNLLRALTGLFLAGMLALFVWTPLKNSQLIQCVGITWVDFFYGLVMILALAAPAGAIAVFARTHWLAEIGRVSYCLYLIHDAVRFGAGLLVKTAIPHVPSWALVAANAVAAVISYLICRVSWVYFEHPLLRRGHEWKY